MLLVRGFNPADKDAMSSMSKPSSKKLLSVAFQDKRRYRACKTVLHVFYAAFNIEEMCISYNLVRLMQSKKINRIREI